MNGLRNARLGAIGARPGAFNTVRYSEKLLQAYGISVTTVDFSEIIGAADKLSDDDPRCRQSWRRFEATPNRTACRRRRWCSMAKLGIVIGDWMDANDLDATAHPMLDLDPEEFRRERLHADEHDERTI